MIRVTARLEYQTRMCSLPDRLWVEVPPGQALQPCERADGFAPALLHLAMTLGESLDLRGVVCPRLIHGLRQYQEAFLVLYPGRFRRSEIKAACSEPAPAAAGNPVVCQAFSGGADSFHTLRNHLPDASSPHGLPVTHALMVHGFDVPLADQTSFAGMVAFYRPLLADLGVQLVTARTNLRDVTSPVNWEISHGAAVAFVALSFGSAIRSFLISSTQAYFELMPWGSDPRIDYWLATQRTEFLHVGAHRTRTEKLLDIADWEPARRGLRVCWANPKGMANCCRCSKCLRTMACLKSAGQLDHFQSFPLPYDRHLLRALIHRDEMGVRAARNLLQAARTMGDTEVEADIQHTLRRSKRRHRLNKLMNWLKGR